MFRKLLKFIGVKQYIHASWMINNGIDGNTVHADTMLVFSPNFKPDGIDELRAHLANTTMEFLNTDDTKEPVVLEPKQIIILSITKL